MATLSDYVSGTISLTTGSVDFTGSATGWLLAAFKEGDTIIDITGAMEYMGVVAEITSNTAGKLTKAWEGPTLVDAPYRMRYQGDNSRVAAQSRNLIELLGNGNLQAVAGLSGSANRVIMFTGPGTMTTIPKTELTSGADYDVQVDLLADRDAYDAQAEGFSVLVSDVGDGRSAIYSKASASSADWTDPAYVTGPIGETPEVAIGTVTTGAPGTDAEVTATPTVDGVELDFTIPAGEGFVFEGAYNGGTAYALGDVVRDAGSSWIALQATTGNAPPTLPTTSNSYWALLAQKGADGTGTGDVVGPAGATDKRLVVFGGPTGKAIVEAAGLSGGEKTQARIDIGTDGGVGNFRDLRSTVFESGVPSDYYNKGTVFGMARGGADGLGIPGLPNTTYGVLRAHGHYPDASALPALQREFSSALGTWRQYAASASVWSAWFRTDGAWEKIAEDSLAGVASWSRAGLGAFRRLKLVAFAKPVSDGVPAMVRVSSDNGASFDAGASDYVIGADYHATGAAISSAGAAYNALYANWLNQVGVNHGIWFEFTLEQFNQAARCHFRGNSGWIQNTSGVLNSALQIVGQRASTVARNAIQFTFGTGNIDSGHIALMGMRG